MCVVCFCVVGIEMGGYVLASGVIEGISDSGHVKYNVLKIQTLTRRWSSFSEAGG